MTSPWNEVKKKKERRKQKVKPPKKEAKIKCPAAVSFLPFKDGGNIPTQVDTGRHKEKGQESPSGPKVVSIVVVVEASRCPFLFISLSFISSRYPLLPSIPSPLPTRWNTWTDQSCSKNWSFSFDSAPLSTLGIKFNAIQQENDETFLKKFHSAPESNVPKNFCSIQ